MMPTTLAGWIGFHRRHNYAIPSLTGVRYSDCDGWCFSFGLLRTTPPVDRNYRCVSLPYFIDTGRMPTGAAMCPVVVPAPRKSKRRTSLERLKRKAVKASRRKNRKGS